MHSDHGVFTGTIKVVPPTSLLLKERNVGGFTVTSTTLTHVVAVSTHPDSEKMFRSDDFLSDLDRLSWDLVWESQAAVKFEIEGGMRTTRDHSGHEITSIEIEDRIDCNPGNRSAGIDHFHNFDLLQRIRDYLILEQFSKRNPQRLAEFQSDAVLLLVVEHFVKGVVNRPYAMAEFYSVAETIWKQLGGRHALDKLLTKAKVDCITRLANSGDHDQRHAPDSPAAVTPLPPGTVESAALVAKEIIKTYVDRIN